MKKSTLSRTITAAIIAISALLCLTACGDDAQSQSENSADATAASTVLTTTPSDESESAAKTTTAKTTTAENKTTTKTTAQTTTMTEATTTAQTTTTAATTTTVATENAEVSYNGQMVAEIITQLGGTPKDTLDSYVAGATDIYELRDAIEKYLDEEQPEYEVIANVTRFSSEELLMMVEYYQTPVIIEENGEIKIFNVSESWEYENLACKVIVIQKQGEL